MAAVHAPFELPATVRSRKPNGTAHEPDCALAVAMLGAVGFLVAENFHPLFGGDINVPSYVAYQQTPLQEFWPAVVGSIGVLEFFSIVTVRYAACRWRVPSSATWLEPVLSLIPSN